MPQKTSVYLTILAIFLVIGMIIIYTLTINNESKIVTIEGMNELPEVSVYKSPTCGCCGNYIDYLGWRGFSVNTIEVDDMDRVKEENNIPSNLLSCHTSIIGNYIVEGHVPTEAIAKLLTEKPGVAGIALPGMPSGAPGMGGGKNGPFIIHFIDNNLEDGGVFMEM